MTRDNDDTISPNQERLEAIRGSDNGIDVEKNVQTDNTLRQRVQLVDNAVYDQFVQTLRVLSNKATVETRPSDTARKKRDARDRTGMTGVEMLGNRLLFKRVDQRRVSLNNFVDEAKEAAFQEHKAKTEIELAGTDRHIKAVSAHLEWNDQFNILNLDETNSKLNYLLRLHSFAEWLVAGQSCFTTREIELKRFEITATFQ